MYRLNHRQKSRRRRLIFWTIVALIIALLIWLIIGWLHRQLHPVTTIKQSKAITTQVTFNVKTKHYDEGTFGIDIPTTWQPIPRPPGPYTSFTWQTSANGSDGQSIEIYQDTIPVNFAVNRVLIVEGQIDHLTVDEPVSDDCQNYTRTNLNVYTGQLGQPAKWQNVAFLCDANNTERDVIGTSSTDGINTVILRGSDGSSHKFFFTYTDNTLNPDYTVFYNALNSFAMD